MSLHAKQDNGAKRHRTYYTKFSSISHMRQVQVRTKMEGSCDHDGSRPLYLQLGDKLPH
jgi:hypothetical protein